MGSPFRALVVEDSQSMRQLLVNLLRERGHEVASVASAEEAIEAFDANPHDLLLVDWTLPEGSGLDLTRTIRSRPAGRDPYILMITGRNGPNHLTQVLDAGASDYVTKPVDSHVLVTRLAIAERQVGEAIARRAMRDRLLLVDRMAAVGTLAAGVAHELNNPLAYVLSSLQLAREELDEGPRRPRILEHIDHAIDGARRMATIVEDLSSFSSEPDDPAEVVDLHEVVTAALHLCWNELRHVARVDKTLDTVPPVLAPRGALSQVILNLLLFTAKVLREDDRGRAITITTSTRPDGRVSVAVGNDGPTIPPDELAHIFDPFFTTQGSSEGTGLGLAVSQNLVRRFGGRLVVESSPGEGTWFRVELPAAPEGAPSQRGRLKGEHHGPITPTGTGAPRAGVVIIDDEATLGRSLARILGAHRVQVFVNGDEALAYFERTAPETIDVIFCDLMMPEMSGMQLFAILQERHPELVERTVFMTGGAFTPRAASFVRNSGRPVLDKPFDINGVRALVRGLLQVRSEVD